MEFIFNQVNTFFTFVDSRVALTKEISANPEGSGPYINMHLPGGWMNLWGHLATHIDVNQMLDIIENYMKRNISFVIDQFHEGIHFGFSVIYYTS